MIDRWAGLHKGLKGVERETQVSLPSCWVDTGTGMEIRNTGGGARGDWLSFESVEQQRPMEHPC